MSDPIERRTFLKMGAGAAAAVLTAGNADARVKGANERINIGVIGTGDRAQGALMNEIRQFSKQQNVAITAVCDVWKVNVNSAAAKVKADFGNEPMVTSRFEEVLASKDIDAVVIATPDFAHSPILIKAVRAGKDVYVEKPMSCTLEEAKEALKASEETGQIVQVGTQRRSDGQHIEARRIMKDQPIGKVTRFQAEFNFNHARWARPYDKVKQADVDWGQFCMGQFSRPFDARMLRQWHLFKACCTGISGLWMVHLVDACQMIMDQPFPATSVAEGGTWVWTQGREHSDTFCALLTYPSGFMFSFAMSLCNSAGGRYAVYGTDGTLDLEKWTINGNGGGGKKVKDTRKIESVGGTHHMLNWLECLRSRKQPNAPIQAGYSHAVATIMTAHALWAGRRKTYDVKAMEIKDA